LNPEAWRPRSIQRGPPRRRKGGESSLTCCHDQLSLRIRSELSSIFELKYLESDPGRQFLLTRVVYP
jgi:hypothetical protein